MSCDNLFLLQFKLESFSAGPSDCTPRRQQKHAAMAWSGSSHPARATVAQSGARHVAVSDVAPLAKLPDWMNILAVPPSYWRPAHTVWLATKHIASWTGGSLWGVHTELDTC